MKKSIVLKFFLYLYRRVGVRIFYSAAISHRHDATTLDTLDGIKITISGFINRSRTHQNGFPSEVYNSSLISSFLYFQSKVQYYMSQLHDIMLGVVVS